MTARSEVFVAQLIVEIAPADATARVQARAHLDTLTKPLGSLGRLEDLAAQLAAIYRGRAMLPLHKAVYIFAADHGIAAEGVSAYPSAVTEQMVRNFLAGGAAINVLARQGGVDLHVVDVGVAADFRATSGLAASGLIDRKIAWGTANMLHGPAMTDEQLFQSLEAGANLATEAAAAGITLLAIGEMGIGNTTAASALTSALTGFPPEQVTGRGTGLDAAAHQRKTLIIADVFTRFFQAHPAPQILDILRYLGGLEIAAMTGMVLSAARYRIPVVADGFISTVAAAFAVALEPNVGDFLIAGHRSEEPGHRILLDYLHLKPLLTLELRLGEGTGAVLAMPLIEGALALYNEMATFTAAGVSEASQ